MPYLFHPLELQKAEVASYTQAPQGNSEVFANFICKAASSVKGLIYLEARACFSEHCGIQFN